MKILRYSNRKAPDWYLDASTSEKETAALWALFYHLRDDWQVYSDMNNIDAEIVLQEKHLQDLRALQLSSIPDLLKQDVDNKLEKIPVIEQLIANLKDQKAQWSKIIAGDAKALRQFLESRSRYEYEQWEFVTIDDPMKRLKKIHQ